MLPSEMLASQFENLVRTEDEDDITGLFMSVCVVASLSSGAIIVFEKQLTKKYLFTTCFTRTVC